MGDSDGNGNGLGTACKEPKHRVVMEHEYTYLGPEIPITWMIS